MSKEQTVGMQNYSVNGAMYELPIPVCEWLKLMEDKCEARGKILAQNEKFGLSQEAEIRDYEKRIARLEAQIEQVQKAFDYANYRFQEWGERAEKVGEMIEQALESK